MNTIYILIDPRTNEVRYVGVTVGSLATRLNVHLQEARNPAKASHKINWIRSLLKKDLRPLIEELEVTPDRSREIHWIAFYRSRGVRLTNMTDGGEGTPGLGRGVKQSPEFVARRSTAMLGVPKTGKMAKGHKKPLKTRRKIASAVKAMWDDPESQARREQVSELGKQMHFLRRRV